MAIIVFFQKKDEGGNCKMIIHRELWHQGLILPLKTLICRLITKPKLYLFFKFLSNFTHTPKTTKLIPNLHIPSWIASYDVLIDLGIFINALLWF